MIFEIVLHLGLCKEKAFRSKPIPKLEFVDGFRNKHQINPLVFVYHVDHDLDLCPVDILLLE